MRPKKFRFINFQPDVTYFKPRAVPLSSLEEVILSVDEIEAIRLHNLEEQDQIKCAKKMKISQSTFQRILEGANKKIADAIIQGKAIRIEGGKVKMIKSGMRKFKCENCGNIWKVPFGTGKCGFEMKCPRCTSFLVHRIDHRGHGGGRMLWGYKFKKNEPESLQ